MKKKLLLILMITSTIFSAQAQENHVLEKHTHSFIVGGGFLRNAFDGYNGAIFKFGYQLHFPNSRFFIGTDFITDYSKVYRYSYYSGPVSRIVKSIGYDLQFDLGFHLIKKRMLGKRKLNVSFILSNGVYLLRENLVDKPSSPNDHHLGTNNNVYTTVLVPCVQMDFSLQVAPHHAIGLSIGLYPKMTNIFDYDMDSMLLFRPVLYYKFSLWSHK